MRRSNPGASEWPSHSFVDGNQTTDESAGRRSGKSRGAEVGRPRGTLERADDSEEDRLGGSKKS